MRSTMLTLLLWVAYVLGQFLAIYFRSSLSVANPFTMWKSVSSYIAGHFKQVVYNFAGATLLFVVWWKNPGALSTVMSFVGIQVASDVITKALPLNVVTAVIYGLFSDRLVDWIVAKLGFTKPVNPSGA